MQASGLIEFGAHSVHHVNLSQAMPASSSRNYRLKTTCRTINRAACMSFAYPFGRFNEQTVER
jgi:hypothetical protein